MLDEENPDEVIYSLVMEKVPESDDGLFYLFALECYEDEEALPGEPAASWKKGTDTSVSLSCEEGYLFSRFVQSCGRENIYQSERERIFPIRRYWRIIRRNIRMWSPKRESCWIPPCWEQRN